MTTAIPLQDLLEQAHLHLKTASTGFNDAENVLIVDHLASFHPNWEGIDTSGEAEKIDCPLCIIQAERLAGSDDAGTIHVQVRHGNIQGFWSFKLKKNKKTKKRLDRMEKALGEAHRTVEPEGAVEEIASFWDKKKHG
jgi:hypothetical protein